MHEFLERLEVAYSAQSIFRAECLDAIQPFEMARVVECPLRLRVRPNLELEVRSGPELVNKEPLNARVFDRTLALGFGGETAASLKPRLLCVSERRQVVTLEIRTRGDDRSNGALSILRQCRRVAVPLVNGGGPCVERRVLGQPGRRGRLGSRR